MSKRTSWFAAVAALLVVAGCAGQKEPATQAVAAVESTLASIKEDAAKFLPEDLSAIESSLAGLKDNLAKADYKAVLAAAPDVSNRGATLQQAVAAKKAEYEAAAATAREQWTSYQDLPKMVEAIQSRVDTLSQSKRLPRNLKQESFDAAKAGLEQVKSAWSEATAAFGQGDSVTAVTKAEAAKQKGTEVMQLLGLRIESPRADRGLSIRKVGSHVRNRRSISRSRVATSR
jgi:hypothetical protein